MVKSWPEEVTMDEWFTPQETIFIIVSNENAQGFV